MCAVFFSEEELSTGVKTDKINIENVGKKVILNQGDLFLSTKT